jgi:hypothetical protein
MYIYIYIFLIVFFFVHFDKYKFFPFQQMHILLNHKMLQFLYYAAPTSFGPHRPSSGSTFQNLTKITLSLKTSVKTLRYICCSVAIGDFCNQKTFIFIGMFISYELFQCVAKYIL